MTGNPTTKFSGGMRRGLASLVEPLVVVAVLLVSTTAIAQPFYIPSGSMEPTLAIGDYLVATKYAYGYSRYSLPFDLGPPSQERLWGRLPQRGDVVVFREPIHPKVNFVKRVIGLPGDRIAMRGGRLFLNGQAVAEKSMGEARVEFGDGHFQTVESYREALPGAAPHLIYRRPGGGFLDDTGEFRVPQGHIFVMGDNRDDSLDSRLAASDGGVGYVPLENLVGQARWVVGSFDFPNARRPASWLSAFRMDRILRQVD